MVVVLIPIIGPVLAAEILAFVPFVAWIPVIGPGLASILTAIAA
jgi:hypothetical protein